MILLALALAAPYVARPLPLEVRRFIARREACDHWRGDDSPDRVRRRQIDRALRKECTGTDRELDRLRQRYRADRRVLARLSGYEKVERR